MAATLLIFAAPGPAAVVINEFMAAASERRLSWDATGMPHLGSGVQWTKLDFNPLSWSNSLLPVGYGFSGLARNLTAEMKDKAPSLYLRKEFQATAAQALATNSLVLSVQYNDGFVAYLNGREVARANCGPTNHFMFCSQPAYNVSAGTNVVQFTLGPAGGRLVAGRNVLAVQAHNAEQPSTTSSPEQSTRHLPTPEFFINAGLQLAGDTNTPPVDLVALGTAGGQWKYLVGRVEPSGGVADLGLVTRVFTPPSGEEDDYDQPAEFTDWIELYNNGTVATNLAGWSLTDDPAVPAKWRFPTNTVIAGGGYLLVMCDQRNEANPPAGPAYRLHTSFQLGDDGEYLGLFDPAGRLVDGLPGGYPPQVWWCSYGRNPTNPAIFGFFSLATPGTNNAGPFYLARFNPPLFQTASGVELPGGLYMNQSPTLYLRHENLDAVIKYTLNGSEPTEANGILYTNPIVLTQTSDKTGVVVRARAFLPGLLPSEVKTHTYLLRQPALLQKAPALVFTADAGLSFYAPDGLLAIVGGQFVAVGGSAIWQANGPQSYDNVLGQGIPFERGAHAEYFFPPGIYPSNQQAYRGDLGLRVSSSPWSRPRMRLSNVATASPWTPGDSTQKPSFNLYFSGDYGPGELNYNLFTNYPVHHFQHLRLRAGKNDPLNPFITDELMRRLWIDMGHVGARGLFCSFYVNGVYKGVFNPCERIRAPFFQAHYDSQAGWDVCYIWSWVDGDNVAYQQLLTALDRDLTNAVNWQTVTNKIDIDNAADYYLLNIYAATWDWPGNNFAIARERSSGPNSRFRFAVWDAEGGFNAIGMGKGVSYNTITKELIVGSTNSYYWSDISRIFRRLATSPEFRLRFADRVNCHMFNGGILDDRDPDGVGPLKSHFRQVQDDLVREAGDLVRYNSGQNLTLGAFTSWASPTAGRRTYLLGSTAGRQMLRDAGFWPVTEPPVFNQHGGTVPPGFMLEMTSTVALPDQTAGICYTTDGSDPRLTGGDWNSSAQIYGGPIPIDQVVTIKARAQNYYTLEWSPLTEATFSTGTVPASSNNLVIAEIMYHPPGPTAAELAAHFTDAEDFEFVRLLNIGPLPVDLSGVRFSVGITNSFSSGAVRYLGSGSSVLAVKNRAAFQFRYGHGCDAMISGEYTGNLSNSGERIQLLATNEAVMRDFTYQDHAPWPVTPDGAGPSLVLLDPWSNPEPAVAANWTASAVPGGLPAGVAPEQSYATWRTLWWGTADAANDAVSGPTADPDRDGLNNFLEYAFALDPQHSSARPQVAAALETLYSDWYLTLSVRTAGGAQNATFTWQTSEDCTYWSDDYGYIQLLERAPQVDGTTLLKYCDGLLPAWQTSRFIRLAVTGP